MKNTKIQKITQHFTLSSLVIASALTPIFAFSANDELTKSITIYGNTPDTWNYRPLYNGSNIQGGAVINKSKIFEFTEGLNTITIDKLPTKVDPASILLKNLSNDKSIVEQKFKSSVFNLGAVMEETIGQEIEVEQVAGDRTMYHRGMLVSNSPNLVIKEDDRLRVINGYSSIILADRKSDGGSNQVEWLIDSELESDDVIEYSYKTEGISWSADYNLYLEKAGSLYTGKLESWSNIYNNTNIDAKGAELKLVAGKVNEVQNNSPKLYAARAVSMDAMETAGAPQMNQESFSDYQMYKLSRQFDVEPFSHKKIKIYNDKESIIVSKKYVFDSSRNGNEIKSIVKIINDQDSNLAIPLPAGKVTVFEKDSSGDYEKSGEAKISHSAVNSEIEIEIGRAFDLTAERRQIDNKRDNTRRTGSYKVEVELSNSKSEPAKIYVNENIYNQNWKISNSSHSYKKTSANAVEFPITVSPKSKVILEYTVNYFW